MIELTKEQIKEALVSTGRIHRFTSDNLWLQAFKIYNLEKKSSLKPSCGSCFQRVKEWLLK